MVVEAAVCGFPSPLVCSLKPVAEPLARQRLGVERFRVGWVQRRRQPDFAQPRDGAPPLLIAEANECIGQAPDRGLSAQRLEAVAGRWTVEQPDAMEDGEQHWLIGEPFFLRGFHVEARINQARFLARARLTAAGCKVEKILALLGVLENEGRCKEDRRLEPSESPGA